MPIFKYLLEPICKSHHDIESGQGKHQVEHGPGVNDLQTKKSFFSIQGSDHRYLIEGDTASAT